MFGLLGGWFEECLESARDTWKRVIITDVGAIERMAWDCLEISNRE